MIIYQAQFDHEGRCIGIMNGPISFDLSPNVTYRAEVPASFTADNCFYDITVGRVIPRFAFNVQTEANKLLGIPEGTKAIFLDQEVVVTDGVLEFETQYPTTLTVQLEHLAFLAQTYEVTCEGSS